GDVNDRGISLNDSQNIVYYAVNNIVYGFGTGVSQGYAGASYTKSGVFYNNTVYNNTVRGLDLDGDAGANNIYARNNLAVNNGTDLLIVNALGTSNNISSDNSSPNGSSYRNQSPLFVDAGNNDLRLHVMDTAAKGRGIDLSNDS